MVLFIDLFFPFFFLFFFLSFFFNPIIHSLLLLTSLAENVPLLLLSGELQVGDFRYEVQCQNWVTEFGQSSQSLFCCPLFFLQILSPSFPNEGYSHLNFSRQAPHLHNDILHAWGGGQTTLYFPSPRRMVPAVWLPSWICMKSDMTLPCSH